MLDLSVVIIACDEERIIDKTLSSVASIAGEIIFVDSGSKDRTVEIARQHGAQCHYQQWLGYAAQKNFALSLATKKWILSLDADEIVTPALAKEIASALTNYTNQAQQEPGGATVETDSTYSAVERGDRAVRSGAWKRASGQAEHRPGSAYIGYSIPRLLYIGEIALHHGGFYPDAQLRLFQNGKGKFIERRVHESVSVDGPIGQLQSPLLHYAYTDFSDYAVTLDRYAQLSAKEFASRTKSSDTVNSDKENNQCQYCPIQAQLSRLWRTSKLNELIHPPWTFFYRYFIRAGFLDGSPGLKVNLIYQDYVRKKIIYLKELEKAK